MFVHRWQLDALIETLGPHAADFGLDEWVAGLNAKQTTVLLPQQRWGWIQAQLEEEILKRHLPLSETKVVRVHWSERCPHNPVCQNATNCDVLSVIAAARKARQG